MENKTTLYGAVLTHPKVAKLLFSDRPSWVWSPRGDRILWANELGCRFFKTKSMPDLLSRKFRRISPATSQISQFAKNANQGDVVETELRFLRGMTPILVNAKLTLITLQDDGQGVLVESKDADTKFDPNLREKAPLRLMKLFSRGEEATALLSAKGEIEEASSAFRDVGLTAADCKTLAATLSGRRSVSAHIEEAKGTLYLTALRKKKGSISKLFATFEHVVKHADAENTKPAPAVVEPTSKAIEATAETAPVAFAGADPIDTSTIPESASDLATEPSASDLKAPPQEPLAETSSVPETAFHFEPSETPSRFLFEFSSDGVLTSTSQDFVTTLGPETGEIAGEPWSTLADQFKLDPAGVVAAHLNKQAIWNEKVLWPVSASADEDNVFLRVPISLTAMPVFDRHRIFEGFRGFGVIHTAEAARHPEIDSPTEPKVKKTEVEAAIDADAEETTAAETPQTETTQASKPPLSLVEDVPPHADDEDGTLQSEEGQTDQRDDNIVRLHKGRPTIVRLDEEEDAPNLSKPERRAFEEIAKALSKPLDKNDDDTKRKDSSIDVDAASAIEGTAKRRSTTTRPKQPVEEPTVEPSPIEEPGEKTPETAKKSIASIAKGLGVGAAAILGSKVLEKRNDNQETTDTNSARTSTEETEHAQPVSETTKPAQDTSVEDGVLDRLPLGLIVTRNRNVLFANRAVLDFLGHDTLKDFRASGGVDRLFSPETDQKPGSFIYRDMFRHLVIQADGHDQPQPQAARARLSDGTTAPVDVRLQSGLWRDEEALLMTIATPVYRDNDDAAADTRISDLIGQSTDVMDIASDGILIIDAEGSLLHANASAEALFGQDRRDIRDLSFVSLFAEESQKSVSDYLDSLTSNGVASILNDGREVIGREANGGLIPLFMTIGRVNKSRSNSPVFCAVLRDITQWKRAEEELIESRRLAENANAQKSDFLAKVSHEIRTPLNAIIGFSDVMMNEHFGPMNNPRYQEYARDINQSGEYLVSLVNDLLDLSKIEAGKVDLTFSSVNINKVLQESVALMQPDANRDRIIIRTSLLDRLPPVVADNRSLRQIALNLLSNAIKFTDAGGQVIVSTTLEENGNVVIRVRDTGIGMSPEDLDRALEPFRQVSADTHGRTGGTGLGLPLTKALVEANRAQFTIDSRLDYGTLIQVVFPTERVLAH